MAPEDPRTDLELVRDANAGDASAFDALYRRHRDWAWRVARRFAASPEDAADVLQDAFLHLWSRFPGFQLTAKLTSYLYPVLKHLAAERAQRGKRYVDAEEGPPDTGRPDEEPTALRDGDLDQVLAALPEGQREVVLLRFVDDLELAEIAAAMEVPVGTVKSRLHTALARLREDPRTARFFEP